MTPPTSTAAWLGLNLRWAYGSLLPALWRSTRCIHPAQDVLHDAFVCYALSCRHERIAQPHAYLRVVARSVLADHMALEQRFVPLPRADAEPGEEQQPRVQQGDEEAFTAPSAEVLADLLQRLAAVQRTLASQPCTELFGISAVGCTPSSIATCTA